MGGDFRNFLGWMGESMGQWVEGGQRRNLHGWECKSMGTVDGIGTEEFSCVGSGRCGCMYGRDGRKSGNLCG